MLDLKIDENFPHHYIIGVAVKSMTSGNPGEMFMKYGPIYFIHDDVIRMRDSAFLSNDKIYKDIYGMSNSEILEMNNCQELAFTIVGVRIAASANQATLHHFSSEVAIPDADKFFNDLVKRANKYDEDKIKLNAARISY